MKTHEVISILRKECDTFDPNITVFMVVLGDTFLHMSTEEMIDVVRGHSDWVCMLTENGVNFSTQVLTNSLGTKARMNIFAFQLDASNN